MSDIGKKLKIARKQCLMTQKEVQEETGILRSQLSKYENDIAEPNIDNLRLLINLYDINANWLLDTEMKKK